MTPEGPCVVDSSVLLAFILEEPAGDMVDEVVDRAVISAVNWSEVLQKVAQRGGSMRTVTGLLTADGLEIAPFGREDAERAAALWPATRTRGLSLADRACLALAAGRGLPVVTADRTWAELGLDIEVVVIR